MIGNLEEIPGVENSAAHGLSVVIPVYNSELILHELAQRLESVLSEITPDYEIVFVDDSSPDSSRNVICQLALQSPRIRALSLMRNYGQHNALLCGIRAARYGVIVTMDDDLQHPVSEAKTAALLRPALQSNGAAAGRQCYHRNRL
jgi:glycosyltransferase involved in cell wall biosynthesis